MRSQNGLVCLCGYLRAVRTWSASDSEIYHDHGIKNGISSVSGGIRLRPLNPTSRSNQINPPNGIQIQFEFQFLNASRDLIPIESNSPWSASSNSNPIPIPGKTLPITGTGRSRVNCVHPGSPTRRQGAARWNATPKQRVQSPADLPPITPSRTRELDVMMVALTAARAEVAERKCTKGNMYERAAALYFEAASRAHLPPGDPPADLRPNPTSGGRIQI